ncbi:DUF2742 domain-containing protein [Mycolicibacterium sp. ND9-15]|uniref:DUF2742 domain-containing protein n=1 Tax=Mycolicibacterium sp. ND9-15 TaxID=3042320 RepID=UPI002DD98FC2|nr:DUF2742 domain-containing protein [Mycolicibacterium sp. ND9-15]WSE56754.1 DUF2742 domain-containing protein [Mycolicibacterium sp. ND9-15]
MPPDEISPEPRFGADQLAKAATDSSQSLSVPEPIALSQQVSWWDVHEFVSPLLTSVQSWPMIGSPAWCELPGDDPRKLAAVFDAARHWALRVETCQQARCDAAQAISAAYDWRQIAQRQFVRDCAREFGAYIPRVSAQ